MPFYMTVRKMTTLQVGNDACWTQIEREQMPMFGSDVACPLEYSRFNICIDDEIEYDDLFVHVDTQIDILCLCSYDIVAKGYGGDGFTIAEPLSATELCPLLAKAQDMARNGTPTLVNVHIGKTSFREGSLSV